MGDIGVSVPSGPVEERQALRCPWCNLTQFVTVKCRRCRMRLVLPEALAIEPEADQAAPAAVIENFGARLAALRRDRKISQKRAAAAMGVARTYFSKLETQGCIPTVGNVIRIAAAVGVSIADLLDDQAAQRLEVGRALRKDPFLRSMRRLARGLKGQDRAKVIAMVHKLALQRQLEPPGAPRIQ